MWKEQQLHGEGSSHCNVGSLQKGAKRGTSSTLVQARKAVQNWVLNVISLRSTKDEGTLYFLIYINPISVSGRKSIILNFQWETWWCLFNMQHWHRLHRTPEQIGSTLHFYATGDQTSKQEKLEDTGSNPQLVQPGLVLQLLQWSYGNLHRLRI